MTNRDMSTKVTFTVGKSRRLKTAMTLMAALVTATAISPFAQADWSIAEGSLVGFVSIKQNSIAENNHFSGVTGSLSDEGAIVASVDLSTVETKVPIRNQRMMQLLFEVANYPEAQVSGQLDPLDIAQLAAGAT